MTRGEFERELEHYIAHRRKAKGLPGWLSGFGRKKKKMHETELPPEVQKYEEGSPAEPLEALPGEEMLDKPGILAKILERLGLVTIEKKEQQPDVPAEEVQHMLAKDETTQDLKEVAKIALALIKQLPPDQLTSFKSSQEFARLKELLKKHQLIK